MGEDIDDIVPRQFWGLCGGYNLGDLLLLVGEDGEKDRREGGEFKEGH